MQTEGDPRALAVLERALFTSGRVTRLRAVAMLARVECDQRIRWLERACRDQDRCVRDTALAVCSWVQKVECAPWPEREELPVPAVLDAGDPASGGEPPEGLSRPGWRWEYAVEVWRSDGLLIGVFLATSFREDDEHAKKIALGQAILASATPRGDQFDVSRAAAFIVDKKHAPVGGPACH